jgi:hypothetical protein
LHYSEPIPDIRIPGITGRDRELIKQLLRLFNTHGGYDKKTFDTIKRTLHYFVKERNKDKINSFEAAVLYRIKALIDNKGSNNKDTTAELTFKEIWDNIKLQFNGESVDGKNWTIKTDLFGEIGSKRLDAVMRNLGGKSDRDNSGDKRIWKFNIRTLERFTRVYKQIPDTIEIEEQTTLDSTLISKAEGLAEEEEEEYDNNESDDNV